MTKNNKTNFNFCRAMNPVVMLFLYTLRQKDKIYNIKYSYMKWLNPITPAFKGYYEKYIKRVETHVFFSFFYGK